MATVREVFDFIDLIAPFHIQLDFDNSGFLVGRSDRKVETILVALDLTEEVLEEAVALGAQLVVAHHPVIFHPIKSITDCDTTGRLLLNLIENGISVICAHTNLDAAYGGVNDCLAKKVGLFDIEQLHQDGTDEQGNGYGIGRIGTVRTPCTAAEFARQVRNILNAPCVRLADAGKQVYRVAVGGGSCGSMLHDAIAAGCDTFLTADVKHDVFLEAKAAGINLLDAGHFSTEDVVCAPLVEQIAERFHELNVIKSNILAESFTII